MALLGETKDIGRGVVATVLRGTGLTTAADALVAGDAALVVKDAHTTKSKDLENGTMLDAAMLVQDLNIAMTWLSYPGRKNATAKAQELVFACELVETVTS